MSLKQETTSQSAVIHCFSSKRENIAFKKITKPGVDGPMAQERSPVPEPILTTVYIYLYLYIYVNYMAMLEWVPVRPTWHHLTLPLNSIYTAKKSKLKVSISTLKIYNFVLLLYGHTV